MLTWLIAVAVLIAIWGVIWNRSLELALGILIGLPLAWLASKFLSPYLLGMQEIPVWLPPLPFAIVVALLFIKGALVWIRGNEALPKPPADQDAHHH